MPRLQAGMNRIGNGLKGLGIRMEDRVALLLLDTEIFPQAFFGAIKMGAVPVCLNTLMRPKDYMYFLNDGRTRVLIIDAALLSAIEPIRKDLRFLEHTVVVNGPAPEWAISLDQLIAGRASQLDTAPTTPDDACFWLYSSGSTGEPKGAVHLQHDMVYSVETYGKQVLGDSGRRCLFFGRQAVFRLRTGQWRSISRSAWGRRRCICPRGPHLPWSTIPSAATGLRCFLASRPFTPLCCSKRAASTE